MEPVTGMWAHLKKTRGLEDNSVLASCESELLELMKQIDIMVHTQRARWDTDRQSLHTRLEHAQQELTLQKASLEHKDQEHAYVGLGKIGQLKQKALDMERNQGSIVTQYELQLSQLRTDLTTMKKDYEKFRKAHTKHLQKERTKTSSEMEDSVSEIRRLTGKLDDYRQKGRDWEHQKRSLTKQIDSLESQKRTLADKLDLVQHQTQGYQSQLDKRRDILTSTETNLRSQISQLEGQLERARDTVNSQDTQISRLRASLEEAMGGQRRALEEKEQMERELRTLQSKTRELEEELGQSHQELESKTDLLRVSESTQQRLARDMSRMEQTLVEKDHSIKSLERVSQHDQLRQIQRLQEELGTAREEAKKFRKQEKQLQDDMSQLHQKLETSKEESLRLKEELANKCDEVVHLEDTMLGKQKLHLLQLQDKIVLMEESHMAQVDGMKSQLSDLTTDLHKRNLAMAALSENSASMERQLRDHNETLERKNAEVQVANAQLDALRLENRHLRKTALRQAQGEVDLEEAEGHLQELQNAYVTSLTALEEQNKKLKVDVASLRDKVNEGDEKTQYRIQAALAESERTLEQLKERQERRVDEVQLAGERRSDSLQRRLEATVSKYEIQIRHLQDEVEGLERELSAQTKHLQRLGLEHEVMSNFVTGVDGIVQQPPRRENSILHDTSTPFSHYSSDLLDTEDELMDSAEVVAANFLAEQEERTRELERKLDLHIEGLKASTDATIKKYTGSI